MRFASCVPVLINTMQCRVLKFSLVHALLHTPRRSGVLFSGVRCASTRGSTGASPAAPNVGGTPESSTTSKPIPGQTGRPSSHVAAEDEGAEYQIPTTKLIQAVRERDFNAVQTHAAGIVQNKWKDEYSVPAACLFILLVTWYWMSSTVRRVRRACSAAEAKVKEEAEQTKVYVNNLVSKWEEELRMADAKLQAILVKNGDLTKDIDRMTAALKQCSIRPTAMKHITATIETSADGAPENSNVNSSGLVPQPSALSKAPASG